MVIVVTIVVASTVIAMTPEVGSRIASAASQTGWPPALSHGDTAARAGARVRAMRVPSAHWHGQEQTPFCFGAAARDARHPCSNPRLRYSVVPAPSVAEITPNLPCAPVESVGPGTTFDGALEVCAFGTPVARAVASVGLVGDSHAMNWMAPIDVVARAKGWGVLGMTRSHCPFSRATLLLPGRDRAGCLLWRRRVIEWFDGHPEVRVVFVAEYTSRDLRVLARPGQSQFAAQAAGYARAWRALPRTVAHIVVIRDNPWRKPGTATCVERAAAQRVPPGPACAASRAAVLRRDPAVAAAVRMHSPRVQVANLTRFMCDRRFCYPVVGGALVNKDTTHLTRVFATTLGPYLLRRVDQLTARWALPRADLVPAAKTRVAPEEATINGPRIERDP
jgi:SGNH domain (fused to AT3 domains)